MLPDVRFFLSRPSYPLGGTLLGTILIRRPLPSQFEGNDSPAVPGKSRSERGDKGKNKSNSISGEENTGEENDDSQHERQPDPKPTLRDLLSSVTVYVAGFCKIDTRWHNVADYTKMYGRIHPYVQLLGEKFDADLLSTSEDTVCFWSTNALDAMELSERKGGRWNHPDITNGDVLAFTFLVDIPHDLPHSTHSATCRYFYSANVLIKSGMQQQILKRGFQVTTDPHQVQSLSSLTPKKETIITGRVKFGNCVGMAHSNGLPCHLTSSEIQRPKGQMTVVQRDRNRSTQSDVQTIRVSNSEGQPVCMMTLIGTQTMVPGSPVHIQWDFPKHLAPENTGSNKDRWIPCYQVGACLQGEECALFEDGVTKRTKSFLFDTCHEFVDPDVTDHVSKTMILSGDTSVEETPSNISTDIMKVGVWCQVDITVMQSQGEYNNLTFQIPCRIRHWLVDEDEEMELEENRVASLVELLGASGEKSQIENAVSPDVFHAKDIIPDLKILALAMEEHLRGGKN
jgi:hypothetical protein